MHKNWSIKTPDPFLQVQLSNALSIHPIIAQLLINREIKNVEQGRDFLYSGISALHDPFLLNDMDKAVARIKKARKDEDLVLVYGDYDVDGVTSSVVLRLALEQLGMTVINYIPHRMSEGYGLNHGIVEYAVEKKVGLIITVDCGISSGDEVRAINTAGMDVIIIDHHEPSVGELPKACAIINPKQKNCTYPFKGLAAVGLVFKLTQALLGDGAKEFLDLVAMGTIADVAELCGENRLIVKEGLTRIQKTNNKGLQALLEVAGIKGKKIQPFHVGFVLGPRINATGRIGSAQDALNLLLSKNEDEALALAKGLDEVNRQRQKTQKDLIEEALIIVEREVNFRDQKVIVLSKEGWHKGVIGIVASRLAEKYFRPAVVISIQDGIGTGSARSIEGFHLYQALTHCARFLKNYGGHEFAAGLTIEAGNIENFQNALNDFAQEELSPDKLVPTVFIDGEIPLSAINLDLSRSIDQLEPYGEGNPSPLFCSRRLTVKSPPALAGRDTIKFWVSDGIATFGAVGFGLAKYMDMVVQSEQIDLVYSIAIDDWNKQPAIQLKIKDIKESLALQEV